MMLSIILALLLQSQAPEPPWVTLQKAARAAREAKDFAESDRLRDEIAAAGWVVRDVAGGFELVPA